MRKRIAVPLALSLVLVTFLLLRVGRGQVPNINQDWPPFVGGATRAALAINAPVIVVDGIVLMLLHDSGVEPGGAKVSLEILYLVGVFFLWLLVGIEIQWRLQQLVPIRAYVRIILDCLALVIGIGLIWLAFAAQQQGDRIMTWGAALWSVAMMGAAGHEIVRFAILRRRTSA